MFGLLLGVATLDIGVFDLLPGVVSLGDLVVLCESVFGVDTLEEDEFVGNSWRCIQIQKDDLEEETAAKSTARLHDFPTIPNLFKQNFRELLAKPRAPTSMAKK